MILIEVVIFAVIMIAIAFAAFAVKLFFRKEGQFVKHCSSIDPETGKPFECVCGGDEKEGCLNRKDTAS
jgi:hypothetical protein